MNTFDENRKESDEHFFDSIGSSLSPSEEQEKDNRPELIRGSVWKVITINFFETQICRPLSKKCNNNSMSLRVKKKNPERLHGRRSHHQGLCLRWPLHNLRFMLEASCPHTVINS